MVDEIFRRSRHPYTVGLMASLPRLDTAPEFLYSIPGQPPDLRSRPTGCVFNPRCGLRRGRDACERTVPPLDEIGPAHSVACHFWRETEAWAAQVEAGIHENTGMAPELP